MEILHIASFNGNIGDNANHNGLRIILGKILSSLGLNPVYEELEIRRFYRKYDGHDKLFFDSKFVKYANSFDLVIIGGGNFFEIKWKDSRTGCTIDISNDDLDLLTTKILFFGLGFDTYKGYTSESKNNFMRFIEQVINKDNFLVSFRNDGSLDQFRTLYGDKLANKIIKFPDGGFFIDVDKKRETLIKKAKKNIVLSLAEDMPEVRFKKKHVSSEYYDLLECFVNYIIDLFNEDNSYHFILMPHIYSDLHFMSKLLNKLPDYIRRSNVSIGPYYTGQGKERSFFATYAQADLVISMRFHGNVCAIANGVYSFGIETYKKIGDLYRELGIEDRIINYHDDSFYEDLLNKTRLYFSKRMENDNQPMKVIEKLHDIFENEIKLLLTV